jgi:hypothetical protein
LLKEHRNDKAKFSIDYKGSTNTNEIDDDKNDLILYELKERFKLIQDNKIPIYRYNYSYAQQTILRKYNVKVSRQTIINRANEGLEKYLITSIDDFSRLMLEARFIEAESSIEHIKSLERIFCTSRISSSLLF